MTLRGFPRSRSDSNFSAPCFLNIVSCRRMLCHLLSFLEERSLRQRCGVFAPLTLPWRPVGTAQTEAELKAPEGPLALDCQAVNLPWARLMLLSSFDSRLFVWFFFFLVVVGRGGILFPDSKKNYRTFLEVQRLRSLTFIVRGTGSILCQGTKMLHAKLQDQRNKKICTHSPSPYT